MTLHLKYKTLFDISILHGYFLNSGIKQHVDLDDNQKKTILKQHSFEDYFDIIPSQETSTLLKNNHFILSKKGTQLSVGLRVSNTNENAPYIAIDPQLTLNFIIKIKDFYFENYTDIPFNTNRLYYFSNAIPSRKITIEPIPEDNPAVPVFDLVDFKYIPFLANPIFISDPFLATEQQSKKLLLDLNSSESKGIFGIISICMTGDTTGLNVVSGTNELKVPSFKIHFNNRKTFWKYRKTNGVFEVETSAEQPLTKNGFVEIDPLTDFTTNPVEATNYNYPNPSVKSIHKTGGKTYSEIFI